MQAEAKDSKATVVVRVNLTFQIHAIHHVSPERTVPEIMAAVRKLYGEDGFLNIIVG